MGGCAVVEECPVGTTLPLHVQGGMEDQTWSGKLATELDLIQKSPVMPTSARVPL